MFKRILYEEWTLIVPLISFAVTFLIFTSFFIRAVLMKKDTVNRLASLALEDESTQPQTERSKNHV